MPRYADDWDEDPDGDNSDDADTIACPYCRKQIHEDSQRCPYCAHYISEEDAPSYKPWWIIIGALLCLFAAYRWIVP